MPARKISILLIDDDATNYLHQMTIRKANCAKSVEIVTNGRSALEYLSSTDHGKHPRPDLILLDINMPVMNGWEFMDEYEKLPKDEKGKMMLTTSINAMDEKRRRAIMRSRDLGTNPLRWLCYMRSRKSTSATNTK